MLNFTFSQRHLLGINAFLLILLLGTLAYVSWSWRNDWRLVQEVPTVVPVIQKVDDNSTKIDAIPNTHLFGKSITNTGAVPLSSLQFKVTGITKITNSKASKAYISLANGPSKIFQVGDNLPYGVKVYDITPDAVILENDGHLEKLPLPREKLVFKARNPVESKTDA